MTVQILRDKLSKLPDYNVTHHCEQEKERLAYGVLRTGVIVPSDAEIDNKYVPTIYDGSWAEYGKIE